MQTGNIDLVLSHLTRTVVLVTTQAVQHWHSADQSLEGVSTVQLGCSFFFKFLTGVEKEILPKGIVLEVKATD